jgi:hypothetical protein
MDAMAPSRSMRAVVVAALLLAQPVAADDDPPPAASRYFLGIGAGLLAGREPKVELVETLSFGVPIGAQYQIVAHLEHAGTRVDDMPTYRDRSAVLAGIRSTPFRPSFRERTPPRLPWRFIDASSLYVTVLVGAESRETITYEMAERHTAKAWGPLVGFGFGLIPLQGNDWGFGFDFTGRLARHDGDNDFGYGYTLFICLMK